MSSAPPPPPPIDDLFSEPATKPNWREQQQQQTQAPMWKDVFKFHAAAQGGDSNALRAMLEGKEINDIDAVDDDGWTPLLYSAWENHTECVRLLLDARASLIVAAPGNGSTALHLSAGNGAVECVQAIVRKNEFCLGRQRMEEVV